MDGFNLFDMGTKKQEATAPIIDTTFRPFDDDYDWDPEPEQPKPKPKPKPAEPLKFNYHDCCGGF